MHITNLGDMSESVIRWFCLLFQQNLIAEIKCVLELNWPSYGERATVPRLFSLDSGRDYEMATEKFICLHRVFSRVRIVHWCVILFRYSITWSDLETNYLPAFFDTTLSLICSFYQTQINKLLNMILTLILV